MRTDYNKLFVNRIGERLRKAQHEQKQTHQMLAENYRTQFQLLSPENFYRERKKREVLKVPVWELIYFTSSIFSWIIFYRTYRFLLVSTQVFVFQSFAVNKLNINP